MDANTPDAAPTLLRRQALRLVGVDDNAIALKRRSGEWQTIRRGAYCPSVPSSWTPPEIAHRTLIAATVPVVADSAVLSHQSAAVMHGLNVWGASLERAHITVAGHGGGHRRRWLHTHMSPLRSDEVVIIGGYRVTSVARTVVDLARTTSFESGVVTADHSLHTRAVTLEELGEACQRARGWPGGGRAARVGDFADGLAESPGESRSRVQMLLSSMPRPRLQVPIWDLDGVLLGRVDFLFDEMRTVGEFDGRVKYGRPLVGQEAAQVGAKRISQVMFEEKVREDAIRAMPFAMARWIWADVNRGLVPQRLEVGFRAGSTMRATPIRGRIG